MNRPIKFMLVTVLILIIAPIVLTTALIYQQKKRDKCDKTTKSRVYY